MADWMAAVSKFGGGGDDPFAGASWLTPKDTSMQQAPLSQNGTTWASSVPGGTDQPAVAPVVVSAEPNGGPTQNAQAIQSGEMPPALTAEQLQEAIRRWQTPGGA